MVHARPERNCPPLAAKRFPVQTFGARQPRTRRRHVQGAWTQAERVRGQHGASQTFGAGATGFMLLPVFWSPLLWLFGPIRLRSTGLFSSMIQCFRLLCPEPPLLFRSGFEESGPS
jgi:hypothetical protein